MPKPYTFPYLFDEAKSISISDLKEWEYLKFNSFKTGTITWSRNGNETGNICIVVRIDADNQFLGLSYKCNETKFRYKVYLTSVPSNLGKGKVWYFICPFTNKRCRKLNFIDNRFMHRSALPSGMYESQTQSKKWRFMDKYYGAYFEADKCYEELYSKHFKKFYNGKPTKRYLKLMKKIQKAEKISPEAIERLLAFGI